MPTGNANYSGKLVSTFNNAGNLETRNADAAINANFTGGTLTMQLTNPTMTIASGPNAGVVSFTNPTNPMGGTITGNSFTIPAGNAGFAQITASTSAGYPVGAGTIVGTTSTAAIGTFKGDGAAGLYANSTDAVNGATVEIYGIKQ